jgi:hypothetical protein
VKYQPRKQGAHDRFQLGNRGHFWNTSQHDSDILLLPLCGDYKTGFEPSLLKNIRHCIQLRCFFMLHSVLLLLHDEEESSSCRMLRVTGVIF